MRTAPTSPYSGGLPDREHPRQRPPRQRPPRTETPSNRDPPGQGTPGQRPPGRNIGPGGHTGSDIIKTPTQRA